MTAINNMTIAELKAEQASYVLADPLLIAVGEWRARRAFIEDTGRRWGLHEAVRCTEVESCCPASTGLHGRSLWLWRQSRHVHTATHVANRFGVARRDLLRADRILRRLEELTCRL